ncbi:MAG: cofactor-independent phosphoglycerate mutase [Bacillota bacterium]
MKYLVILGDGMADYPCDELGGITPLQKAATPNMDRLASEGVMGMARTVPDGFPPGSDVANLSVMGYDPAVYYTGRAPLEAVSMGVKLAENDVALRCNLVTLSGEEDYERKVMADYSAGEIESGQAAVLIRELDAFLNKDNMKFYPGVSYRHLMVWSDGPADTRLTPPHDISGKVIADYLPSGNGGQDLLSLMKLSHPFLKYHRVNAARGDRPANSVWFWGQGKTPALKGFREKYGLSGSVISAVDLIKGIGICAGLEVVEVEGATGNIHTNFHGKAAAIIESFRKGADFVYAHIEAPDEAGHQGDMKTKIKAIEEIDSKVLGPVLSQMEEFGHYKILVLPDHPTPLSIMTHTADPVPFVIFDSRRPGYNPGVKYCEEEAAKGRFIEKGHDLMGMFLKD